jgi:hypothetical protein
MTLTFLSVSKQLRVTRLEAGGKAEFHLAASRGGGSGWNGVCPADRPLSSDGCAPLRGWYITLGAVNREPKQSR